jgi:phosphinothricin acetyltransferase
MLIRKAAEGDLDAIDRIYNQSVAAKFIVADLAPFTAAKRAEGFREHGDRYPVFVAEAAEGRGVSGFLSLSPYRPGREAVKQTAEVSYFVDENSRRTGVAGALLAHAEAMCGELGIKTLFAVIIDRNAPSIALIEKHGYQRWGYLPGVAVFDGSEAGHLYYGKRVAP